MEMDEVSSFNIKNGRFVHFHHFLNNLFKNKDFEIFCENENITFLKNES